MTRIFIKFALRFGDLDLVNINLNQSQLLLKNIAFSLETPINRSQNLIQNSVLPLGTGEFFNIHY